jgi:hypothetical protein
MFALPGLLALAFVDWMRPQVHFPVLKALQPLHLSVVLAMGGFVVDLRLALSRLRAAPHLVFTLLFFGWCLVTLAVRAPGTLLSTAITTLLIPLAIYLVTAHVVQSFRMLQVLAGLVLAMAITLAAFGIYQGFAPKACHRLLPLGQSDVAWVADDRPCEIRQDCERDGEPGADYACERVGLFDTCTVGGRVRWMGTMEDPNELALALGISLPFAFAFLDRRRTGPRLLLVGVTAAVVGFCAILTQSRGGQLVFATVLGIYFVRRVGITRGGIVGLLFAIPFIMFGGRSGDTAESSTEERTYLWWYGLHMFTASPLVGVGAGRFLEYQHLTAHNSYILALAELGFPGLFLLSAILWLAMKIPIQVTRSPDVAPVARHWASAMIASMAGLLVGILFLSYIYKNVLWLFVGLTGALYHAVKRHDPKFEVTFGVKDLWPVLGIDVALTVALIGFTGLKLGW